MKRRDNYWLRGAEKGGWSDCVILFRIDYDTLTGMASSGQVVMLRSKDMTVVEESIKVRDQDYFRRLSYTITALRTVWETLAKTGLWTPSVHPPYRSSGNFFNPFGDK